MTPNQPDRPSPQNTRDLTIDILRGLAIFTMLCANAIGYVTPSSEHPVWIKFYGSFAAPLFILLAGYMASMGLVQKGYPFSYYMKRGLMVILTAVVIDTLIWEILPFTTFDVLYVIGFSLPLIYFWFIRLVHPLLKRMDIRPHKEIGNDFFLWEGKYVYESSLSCFRFGWVWLYSGIVQRWENHLRHHASKAEASVSRLQQPGFDLARNKTKDFSYGACGIETGLCCSRCTAGRVQSMWGNTPSESRVC